MQIFKALTDLIDSFFNSVNALFSSPVELSPPTRFDDRIPEEIVLGDPTDYPKGLLRMTYPVPSRPVVFDPAEVQSKRIRTEEELKMGA
jgi:hypothetical protein